MLMCIFEIRGQSCAQVWMPNLKFKSPTDSSNCNMVNPLFKISKMVIFFKVLILRSGIKISFIGILIEAFVKVV